MTHSEEVFKTFQAGTALRAKLVGKGIVALSGGLDSRLVAASLPKDVDFSAFTFVDSTVTSDTVEVRTAAEISKILKLEHHIERIPESGISQVADDVIMLTGGLMPSHHPAKVMSYVREMKQRGFNFMLGGGPGDVLAGSYIPSTNYLNPYKMEECIRSFCCKRALGGRRLESFLALLFHKDILNEYFPLIERSLLKSFQNVAGPTAAHRVTAWAMVNRQPSFTFTSLIHNHPDLAEAFCHLGYRYCDLILKLPADWLYQRNFYAFMIYNCLPQLRHVVYANTGKPLPGRMIPFNYRHSKVQQVISKSKNFGKKVIKRLKYTAPSYPFHYSLLRNDEKLFAEIADIIRSNLLLKEILDDKKCMQFLDNFKAGRIQTQSFSHDAELLGSLATMCFGFKKFYS